MNKKEVDLSRQGYIDLLVAVYELAFDDIIHPKWFMTQKDQDEAWVFICRNPYGLNENVLEYISKKLGILEEYKERKRKYE